MSDFRFISRLVRDAVDSVHNTLNLQKVELYFQRSPDRPDGAARGIDQLHYRVRTGGHVSPQRTTGDDGKITLLMLGGQCTLELLHNGNPVATYELTSTSTAFEPATAIEGQKQRLRMLGYHIGHDGPHNNGVDTVDNLKYRSSVLNYQADQPRDHTGDADAGTQNDLTTDAGA